MSRYRVEQFATAIALSITGLAVAAAIVIRTVGEAIDAATSWPRPDAVPDTVPNWMNEEADLP